MIESERVSHLNKHPIKKRDYVLYWMQASQRAEYNHALEYAVSTARDLDNPLVVFFGLTDAYPEANYRHYRFMIEGLTEVQASLKERGIRMVVQLVSPEKWVKALAGDASCVIVDAGYTRIQRTWRRNAAQSIDCSMVCVESDVVLPVSTVSHKEEYAAATIRKKITGRLDDYLVPFKKRTLKKDSLSLPFETLDLSSVDHVLSQLAIDQRVGRAPFFRGGTSEAVKRLNDFIKDNPSPFPDRRNDPTEDCLSGMSPYLHFGQISPLYIALEVQKAGGTAADAYLEELLVRRELSMNFVWYNPQYDSIDCLPDWARSTLDRHRTDKRNVIYTLQEFEEGITHDPYWNAAQHEMVITGKMHGYMRMYWGKKIIEWSENPEDAYRTALHLNNTYELDGRDPNGYAGVAWCFGKHDRPWAERPVFGTVRYMNAKGLERKFAMKRYVEKIERLRAEQS